MKRMITLAALDKESGRLNAIVDTPKGSRNKFKYDEQLGLFKLGGTLPVGNVFPFDFGYIPSTRGDDGDALDILLLKVSSCGPEQEDSESGATISPNRTSSLCNLCVLCASV